MDVDESPALATKYAVRALPTLVIFSGGAPAAAHLGVLSEDALHTWVKETTGLTPGS